MVAVVAEKADRLEQRNLPLELGQQERRGADRTPDNGCEDAGAVVLRQRNGCGTGALREESVRAGLRRDRNRRGGQSKRRGEVCGRFESEARSASPQSFAAHLGRVEVVRTETPAGCEALEKTLIGEHLSERLDVTPAKFRVIVTRRSGIADRRVEIR